MHDPTSQDPTRTDEDFSLDSHGALSSYSRADQYPRRMRRYSSLILVGVIALAASACTRTSETNNVATLENGGEPTSEVSTPDPVDTEEAILDFTQCLRDNGIEVDDASVDAEGNPQLPAITFESGPDDDPEAAMARIDGVMAECEQHLEGIALTGAPPGGDVEFEDAFIEYAQCMRDEGIDMPDPDFSGTGGMIELGSTDIAEQDEFDAAHETCRPILARIGVEF